MIFLKPIYTSAFQADYIRLRCSFLRGLFAKKPNFYDRMFPVFRLTEIEEVLKSRNLQKFTAGLLRESSAKYITNKPKRKVVMPNYVIEREIPWRDASESSSFKQGTSIKTASSPGLPEMAAIFVGRDSLFVTVLN